MRPVLLLCTFYVIYFTLSRRGGARAVFEDGAQYQKMSFDLLLRGSWMLDGCAADLFNCYEIVKADVMCNNDKYYSSVCGVQREFCHNQYGQVDDPYWHGMRLYEELCADVTYEAWTRRAAGARVRLLAGPARGRARAALPDGLHTAYTTTHSLT